LLEPILAQDTCQLVISSAVIIPYSMKSALKFITRLISKQTHPEPSTKVIVQPSSNRTCPNVQAPSVSVQRGTEDGHSADRRGYTQN
jgi:hypothetical protein